MEFEGKVWKDGRFWIAEVPSLNLMTQGRTRKEALAMVEDAALGLIECYFESEDKNLCITTTDYKKDSFGITSSNNKLLLALSLRRQREKSGLTVRETTRRLGTTSPNSYAQYEKGRTRISLEQYEKLIHAVNPGRTNVLRIV